MWRRTGVIPSGETFRLAEPRSDPASWLRPADAPYDPDVGPGLVVSPGDIVAFDLWETLGSAILLSGTEGGWRIDGTEPVGWKVVTNPLDQQGRDYDTLDEFAAQWLRDGRVTVGVVFGEWTRGVNYRVVKDDDGRLDAVPV